MKKPPALGIVLLMLKKKKNQIFFLTKIKLKFYVTDMSTYLDNP